jgi:hypothetical protein
MMGAGGTVVLGKDHAARALSSGSLTLLAVFMLVSVAVAQDKGASNAIVVSATRNIVVNGHAVRCRPRPGDPLDDVKVGGGLDHMMIVPDGQAGYAWVHNTEQITGPDFWQRVGIGMVAYRFRGPSGDKPMCVGGHGETSNFGGFRRIVDAAPYRGRRLRFTAWAATRNAGQVSFWLAAGTPWRPKPDRSTSEQYEKVRPNHLLNGGNTNNVRFGGDNGWTPVLLETGPIGKDADHVSYGFNLQGSGDVWVYRPKLEIVTDPTDAARTGDRIVIGSDQE